MGNASMGRTFPTPPPEPEPLRIETAQEARVKHLLNPPPSRMVERTAHHLRTFATMDGQGIRLILECVERKLADLAPSVERPPREWTGDSWRGARERVEEWGAVATAARKVLRGREPGW